MIAGSATIWGLGTVATSWNERGTLRATPPQFFAPQRLLMPMHCADFTIDQILINGQPMLAFPVPAVLFSEVSTFPPIAWPHVSPAGGVVIDWQAPPRPRDPHWSLWRTPIRVLRRGLWFKRRRRLPRWVPPRPPVFQAAFYGAELRAGFQWTKTN